MLQKRLDGFHGFPDHEVIDDVASSVVDQAFVCENLYETVKDVLRYNQLEPMQKLDRKPKYWTV